MRFLHLSLFYIQFMIISYDTNQAIYTKYSTIIFKQILIDNIKIEIFFVLFLYQGTLN